MEPSSTLITSETLTLDAVKEVLDPNTAAALLSVNSLNELLDLPTLGLVALRLLPPAAAGVGVWMLLMWLRRFLRKYLEKRTDNGIKANWATWALQLVRGTRTWFITLQAVLVALALMPVPENAIKVIGHTAAILGLIQLGLWANLLMDEASRRHLLLHPNDGVRRTTLSTLTMIGHILVWGLVLLAVLSNIGVNVSAFVAGLGIGGVAIAFASQNLLQSIFASLGTVFDSPFALGDFINTKEHSGSVEKIGLKTTTLRAPGGEQVLVANNDLFSGRIINYGRMRERRVLFTLMVDPTAAADALEKVPGIIKAAILSHEEVRFDRAHLKEITLNGAVYEVIYFMTRPDFGLMMDTQQAVLLAIHRAFQTEGIAFAVPVQKQVGGEAAAA